MSARENAIQSAELRGTNSDLQDFLRWCAEHRLDP